VEVLRMNNDDYQSVHPMPPRRRQVLDYAAFTLVELLAVIGVIGILAALVLPSLSGAKAAARRTECLNNLKQVDLGLLMYADDYGQVLPGNSPKPPGVHGWYAFKSLMKSYVGLQGASSPKDRVFCCPADTFFFNDGVDNGPLFYSMGVHEQPWSDYSSFGFSCGNLVTNAFYRGSLCRFPGVGSERLSAIKDSSRTLFIAEEPAFVPYSWHQARWRVSSNYPFNDARCAVSFIDGHVNYLRFYWDKTLASGIESWYYDPPANYGYRWSAR
jgi:prepilin-type N-terminal cleavage/methylation domain-containing protein